MAVQAQFFPENLGFPISGSPEFFFNLQQKQQQMNQEIDYFIRSQNESLRWVLREQTKQQMAAFLKRIEVKTAIMLRDKEEEIMRAAKKTMELEIFLRKLETENQIWERIARESEAMAVSLNNTLDQMRERASNCFENGGAEDAESCCEMNRDEQCCDLEQKKMICRNCKSGKISVIFLPCRHLCCCKDCEVVLDSCPVCTMGKKATIEALIF